MRTERRSAVSVLGIVGLAVALIEVLYRWGAIESLWEPFAVVTPGGLILPASAAPLPEIGVLGFVALLATAWLERSARTSEQHRRRTIACGAAALVVAASALIRWTAQYMAAEMTSTLFTIGAAIALATVPLTLDDFVAALRGRPVARPDKDDLAAHAAGAAGIAIGVMLLFVDRELLGSVVVAVGVVSLPRSTRLLRWVNALIGAWLMIAPIVRGHGLELTVRLVLLGLLLLVTSVVFADPSRLPRSGWSETRRRGMHAR